MQRANGKQKPMTANSPITRRVFLSTSVSASALLACQAGAAAQGATDWEAGAPERWSKIVAAAKAEGQVTVAAFPLLAEKMTAAFERDSGIRLNFLGGNTAEQSARLAEEARAHNLTIDILIGGGRELELARQGLMQPILPQLVLPGISPDHFRDGKYKFVDNAGQYLLQGAEYVFGWLTVNSDIIKPGEISTWKDLLDPKFRGKIASYDLRYPGPGQGASTWLYKLYGIEFIKDLFLGQQVKFSVDNRALMEGVVRGTAPILFAGIQVEVERFRANFKNIAVILPKDAPGYLTGGFSVIKQAKGVPHPNAATVFINWYMSKPGQEVYQSTMLEVSRRMDLQETMPDYLVPGARGISYHDDYNEDYYFARTGMVKVISNALGQR